MDVTQYRKKKAAGLLAAAKVGRAFVITVRRFDSESGEEIAPTAEAISLDDVTLLEEKLTKHLAEVRALKADLAAL